MKRCCDCKKVLWPWQRLGIDHRSHRECHRQRCRNLYMEYLRDGNLKACRMLSKEVATIERLYSRFA